ncbi:MAG: hypothetical protein PHC61_18130, partial [Chitinivibrionales bacterium]|nr:hypothetical protein [Chitinivibrionales bacterium]
NICQATRILKRCSMIGVMLLTQNEREEKILKMALEQRQFKIVLSKPKYQNYIVALQFTPDIILMEIPAQNLEPLYFARLIRKHRKTRLVPIIGYGEQVPQPVLKSINAMAFPTIWKNPLNSPACLGFSKIF